MSVEAASSITCPPEALIVLGGGRPKSLLEPPKHVQNRCDLAAKIYLEAKKKGTQIYIVTLSAGTAHTSQLLNKKGLPIWESAASAAYLVKRHGVDPKAILMETTSYDTIGNAFFARTQICDQMGFKRIAVITSDFHMPRSRAIFDWIFNLDRANSKAEKNSSGAENKNTSAPVEISYLATPNAGLSNEEVKAREEREKRSLGNVLKLAKSHKSLKDVLLFLMTDHRMYSVEGLEAEAEEISDDLKRSYDS
eukprot:CAMPEP_0184496304 /NCGR_PEP_ID=MMETSP0113_2-20130426/33612_1 /TAXON_ID=91329 /ORGANISM="Norrisiella sphaerica, Strain BC52" /LENGTH=250 /DNA_ID=CAMNT_0026882873 /DNA_START=109 /DNA_END=861 /DNA_ORIENTATION=+